MGICFMELPWWLSVKNPPANAGNMGSILVSGRFPGGGNGNPLQHFCLGNTVSSVYEVTKESNTA